MDARAVTRRAGWWLSFSSGHHRHCPSGPTLICVPRLRYPDELSMFEVTRMVPLLGPPSSPSKRHWSFALVPAPLNKIPNFLNKRVKVKFAAQTAKLSSFAIYTPKTEGLSYADQQPHSIPVAFREKSPALDLDSPYLS